jgi:thioredoxin reductase (NADPH)
VKNSKTFLSEQITIFKEILFMKPVQLIVDDDPQVLQAVGIDLRHKYGDRFRILKADSGATALDLLKQLKLRNELPALFLVDQRMPQMTGVEFLEEAKMIFPDAKRVLLTAYADTDAAIRSINKAKIDFYLMKPWDPPEQNLFPVIDDLLDDWMASFRPPFEGIRVVGLRWSPKSYETRDFLARNGIPYQWLDAESDKEAKSLIEYATTSNSEGLASPHLPLVLFTDGTHISEPTNSQIADKIGLKSHAQMPFYDLIIVGAGPSGLAAAVYGASEGLHTLLIEKEAPGGQAAMSSNIENYLGFPTGLTGANLARRAVAQAARFGAEILTPQEATGIRVDDPYRFVKLNDGTEISCHALLIASGVSYRRLDVPGIERLTGAGVYYGAAMTQALSYRDEDVYMVGGANSAGQAAMFFSKYARQVTILARGDSLAKSMSQYMVDQINQTKNIRVWLHSSVVEVKGENRLEAITVNNAIRGEKQTVPTEGLFIFIGAQPRTDWLSGVVARDAYGFILTGPDLMMHGGHNYNRPKGWNLERQPFLLETNIPGVFAAGDVRSGSLKRLASGVGEGSIAVQFVHQYLKRV